MICRGYSDDKPIGLPVSIFQLFSPAVILRSAHHETVVQLLATDRLFVYVCTAVTRTSIRFDRFQERGGRVSDLLSPLRFVSARLGDLSSKFQRQMPTSLGQLL
jgi:hypothetical protein